MTRELLEQYLDICGEIKELERPVVDSVQGSEENFPYTLHTISIRGVVPGRELQKEQLYRQKAEIELFVLSLPPKQRRVVRFRALEGLTWGQVAAKMGHRYSESGVKVIYHRTMKKNCQM